MKKDIKFPKVEDVFVTVILKNEDWKVYLINRNKSKLENILVTSKGYGEHKGEQKKTSVLRHAIPMLEPGEYALIEPIMPEVLHLNNEYWVSFFIDKQVYDKKFIFVPDTIKEENLIYIPELDAKGVLHG